MSRSGQLNQRRTLSGALAAVSVACYALLALTSYLSINHHEPLRRAGLTSLAAVLAPHPFRWSVALAVVGTLALLIHWRVSRQ